jgi:ribosomal protein S18 acetylase RimI-like enzyme
MTMDDFEQVHALWSVTDGVQPHPVDNNRETMERYLRRNPTSVFVAEDVAAADVAAGSAAADSEGKGRIIGIILCGHDGRRGYIYQLAVAEAYRGRGIGTALVDAGVKALQEEGIGRVGLFVLVSKQITIDYWEKMGWEAKDFMTFRLKDID